jgi:tetratricopeptide (TPR) repeat protein
MKHKTIQRVLLLAACIGCSANEPREPTTFNRDIAPIIFEHCATCHRPEGSAPFSLLDYADVIAHAEQIAFVTQSRYMPPWKPKRDYGRFVGERGLTDEEIVTIQRWIEEGEEEGAETDLPPPPQWATDWELGSPDLIAQMPTSYTLRADGPDVFRNFVIPLPVEKARYVRAIEFKPDNARIVHHATMMVDRSGAARRKDGLDSEPGFDGMSFGEAQDADGHFLGWTQGKTPYAELPDGKELGLIWIEEWDFNWQDDYRFAEPVFLPAGATVVMEYTYDNSGNNPRNPHDPPERVRYGLHSTDEMGDLTIQVLPRRDEDLPRLKRDFSRKWLLQEIDGYNMLIATDPSDWDTHHTLAMFYIGAGQRSLGFEHFEKALKHNPDYSEAWVNYGIALAQDNELERAVANFQQALRRKPNFAQAHFNMGMALHMLGRGDEARPHLDEVIRQRPEMAEGIRQRLRQLPH